jgi:hypothetical protein
MLGRSCLMDQIMQSMMVCSWLAGTLSSAWKVLLTTVLRNTKKLTRWSGKLLKSPEIMPRVAPKTHSKMLGMNSNDELRELLDHLGEEQQHLRLAQHLDLVSS